MFGSPDTLFNTQGSIFNVDSGQNRYRHWFDRSAHGCRSRDSAIEVRQFDPASVRMKSNTRVVVTGVGTNQNSAPVSRRPQAREHELAAPRQRGAPTFQRSSLPAIPSAISVKTIAVPRSATAAPSSLRTDGASDISDPKNANMSSPATPIHSASNIS
jgi:hypothetical protein